MSESHGESAARWSVLGLLALLGCAPEPDNAMQSQPAAVAVRPEATAQPHTDAAGDPDITSDTTSPASAATGRVPTFMTLADDSGFHFQREDDITGRRRIFETTGGGVALFDFDRDGWLDHFWTNGCRMPARPDDQASPSQVFRGRPGLQCTRCTSSARIDQFGYAQGCAVGDLNADGFDDLYVTGFHRNSLWLNCGDGTFTDATDQADAAVPVWSTSAACGDVNVDGLLDLYIANYLDESDEQPRLCPSSQSPDGYQGCSPALFDGVDDVLLLNHGTWPLEDVSAAMGISGSRGKGLGIVIVDLDFDRLPEIYVANDGEANFLWHWQMENPTAVAAQRKLWFNEIALASGVALNERGFAQASMGIAVGDYDANGSFDLFLTHFYGDTNTLYANQGSLAFTEETRRSGVGVTSRQFLGFGTLLVDFDNDCWLDLFIANGHVDDRTWMTPSQPYAMRPQLYRNERDGTFAEVRSAGGEYFAQTWIGRGAAGGDLDRDGRIDLAVSHQRSPSVLLRNMTPHAGAAVTLQLIGRESNRNGYGAWVEVAGAEPPVLRDLSGGVGYQSASAPEIHVGLGAAVSSPLRIHWPSGRVDDIPSITAGHWAAIEGGGCWRLNSFPALPPAPPADDQSSAIVPAAPRTIPAVRTAAPAKSANQLIQD